MSLLWQFIKMDQNKIKQLEKEIKELRKEKSDKNKLEKLHLERDRLLKERKEDEESNTFKGKFKKFSKNFINIMKEVSK